VPGDGQSYSSFPTSGAKTLNLYASQRYYGSCSDVKLALRCHSWCYTKASGATTVVLPTVCAHRPDSGHSSRCPIACSLATQTT